MSYCILYCILQDNTLNCDIAWSRKKYYMQYDTRQCQKSYLIVQIKSSVSILFYNILQECKPNVCTNVGSKDGPKTTFGRNFSKILRPLYIQILKVGGYIFLPSNFHFGVGGIFLPLEGSEDDGAQFLHVGLLEITTLTT